MPLPPPSASPSSKDPFYPWRLSNHPSRNKCLLNTCNSFKVKKTTFPFCLRKQKSYYQRLPSSTGVFTQLFAQNNLCIISVSQKCPNQLLTQPLFPSSAIQTNNLGWKHIKTQTLPKSQGLKQKVQGEEHKEHALK